MVLLSPRARASWRVVGGLCAVLLAVRVLDTVWLMAPAFEHGPHAPPGWLTGAAIVALGAVWLLAFLWQLAGRARGVAADIEEAGCDGGG